MKPNKYTRRMNLYNRLMALGFTMAECDQLRRIERTLHRWAEHECNGNIQREGDDGEGKPQWWPNESKWITDPKPFKIADRERGALKRLAAILANHPELWSYHQGDCRGCALYVGRKSDLRPNQELESCYSSVGVAVCD